MISTIESKAQQLANGFFQSGTGPEQILIIGSCRTLAFLSYLIRWNETVGGNRFTILRMDPCDWAVSGVDVASLETDERILSVFRSTEIFIHEHLESYGMFNTSKQQSKSAYYFGVNPKIDILIPNFHDHFLLENDYASCGIPTPDDYVERGEAEIEKFCKVCEMSSFPEFANLFRIHWRSTRYFWRPNHTSAAFTMDIWALMNSKFLHLPIPNEMWRAMQEEDLFKNPHTEVTQRDREAYGLTWN